MSIIRRVKKSINGIFWHHFFKLTFQIVRGCFICLIFFAFGFKPDSDIQTKGQERERLCLNKGWRFFKYESGSIVDSLIYDARPTVLDNRDDKPADARPTEAVKIEATRQVLKPWILPTGNAFIKNPQKRYIRPQGDPGIDFAFVRPNFDDS